MLRIGGRGTVFSWRDSGRGWTGGGVFRRPGAGKRTHDRNHSAGVPRRSLPTLAVPIRVTDRCGICRKCRGGAVGMFDEVSQVRWTDPGAAGSRFQAATGASLPAGRGLHQHVGQAEFGANASEVPHRLGLPAQNHLKLVGPLPGRRRPPGWQLRRTPRCGSVSTSI